MHSRGADHYCAKLTDVQVLDITELFEHGIKVVKIAKLYGIGKSTVNDILSGRTWKHLKRKFFNRGAVGQYNGRAKLQPGQVRQIRLLKEEGMSAAEISRATKINHDNIRNILTGRTWKRFKFYNNE